MFGVNGMPRILEWKEEFDRLYMNNYEWCDCELIGKVSTASDQFREIIIPNWKIENNLIREQWYRK